MFDSFVGVFYARNMYISQSTFAWFTRKTPTTIMPVVRATPLQHTPWLLARIWFLAKRGF